MSKENQAFTFHIEEYKGLRQEIAANDAEISRVETVCATAVGAIWLWLLREHPPDWEFILPIPVLVILFGMVRTSALFRGVKNIAAYLRRLDAKYADETVGGWETCIQKIRDDRIKNREKHPNTSYQHSTNFFMGALLMADVVMSIAYAIKVTVAQS